MDRPGYPWDFLLALITLGGFVWCELKVPDPLLELRLFKRKNFLMTNTAMVLLFFSFAGISYLLPFYLEYVQGYAPSVAGLILTSLSVAMMVGGILAGVLYNRAGGRLLCIAAGISIVAGYFLMTRIRRGYNHRICGPLPGPDRFRAWADADTGIEHDHELGLERNTRGWSRASPASNGSLP